jgi:hypothetical protein
MRLDSSRGPAWFRSAVGLRCLKGPWPSWSGGTYEHCGEVSEAIGEIEGVLAAA